MSVFAKFIDTGGNNLLRFTEGQPVLWIYASPRTRETILRYTTSLEELRGLGFTWTRIAKMLNVSQSTIHSLHGLEGLSKFLDITGAEVDYVIEDHISPSSRNKDCRSSFIESAMTRITERAISTPLKTLAAIG